MSSLSRPAPPIVAAPARDAPLLGLTVGRRGFEISPAGPVVGSPQRRVDV